uniref:Uncharacterized protein n=1 Tax=Anguilla anguilla TaxID=7936 RepID=A0A0E9S889_ANGAN
MLTQHTCVILNPYSRPTWTISCFQLSVLSHCLSLAGCVRCARPSLLILTLSSLPLSCAAMETQLMLPHAPAF